eukprot:gene22975-29767_t
MSTTERLIEVGERYMITWRDGQRIPGDIIELRPIKKYRTNNVDLNQLKPNDYEYYIHYPSYDRRLDEWVSYDRIDKQTVVV